MARNLFIYTIAGVLWGVIIALALRASTSNASHLHDPWKFYNGILYNDPDTSCVKKSTNITASNSIIRNQVNNVFDGSQSWNGNRYILMKGHLSSSQCPYAFNANLGGDEDADDQFDIVIFVDDDIEQECNPDAVTNPAGCQGFILPVDDLREDALLEEADLFRVSVIHIEWDNLYGNTHTLSHELGHGWGLCDGGDDDDFTPSSFCDHPAYTNCGSVMHSYGCSDLAWPTDSDTFSQEYQVPEIEGGYGFGGKLFL